MFIRVTGDGSGGSVVAVGGLTRSDAAGGFEVEFAELTEEIRTALQAGEADSGRPAGDEAAVAQAQGE
jgi:hypothetical protein